MRGRVDIFGWLTASTSIGPVMVWYCTYSTPIIIYKCKLRELPKISCFLNIVYRSYHNSYI